MKKTSFLLGTLSLALTLAGCGPGLCFGAGQCSAVSAAIISTPTSLRIHDCHAIGVSLLGEPDTEGAAVSVHLDLPGGATAYDDAHACAWELNSKTTWSVPSAVKNFVIYVKLTQTGTQQITLRAEGYPAQTKQIVATFDSFNQARRGPNGTVRVIRSDSLGQLLVGGGFTQWDTRPQGRVVRLLADGTLDTTFDVGMGFNAIVLDLAVQADGKIVVGGSFTELNGVSRPYIARLHPDGSPDTTFGPAATINGGIRAIQIQVDGRILVGGEFTLWGEGSAAYMARLNSDGTRDMSFDVGVGFDNIVNALAVLADEKILVVGQFQNFDGVSRRRLARLNPDGTWDNTFTIGTGFGSSVNSLAVRDDGYFWTGGIFSNYNGTSRVRIARIEPDGALDTTFVPGTGLSGRGWTLAQQPDGKIVAGGEFTTAMGTSRNRIARINTNGTLDTTFDPGTGFDSSVISLFRQSDGKIITGGTFDSFNGTGRRCFVRLTTDGELDADFVPNPGVDFTVYTAVPTPQGRVLIGGDFASIGTSPRLRFGRVLESGVLDTAYDPGTGFSAAVNTVLPVADGSAWVGGAFTLALSEPRGRLAKLTPSGSLNSAAFSGAGFDNIVNALDHAASGGVWVACAFTEVNATSRPRIARLAADGTLDPAFDPGVGFDATVHALSATSDGGVWVGGAFSQYQGTGVAGVVRLTPTGAIAPGFDPGTGFNGLVRAMAAATDGAVWVAGDFTEYNDTSRNRIARLWPDGSLDLDFDPGVGFNNTVHSLTAQPNGLVVAGGGFTLYQGETAVRIARITPQAQLDPGFEVGTGFNRAVRSVRFSNNGKLLVAGEFTAYQDVTHMYLARLTLNGAID